MQSRGTEALEILKITQEVTITPEQAAEVLQCSAQNIRDMAHANPGALGFPTTCVGNRVIIPRIPFIKYLTT
ncbi:MAG TPA: hypothetical protein PKL77_11450 [Candidatus Omnitrophota bacterium]|nr:hypothetical protein [Candidatus Omnitrophota bacterium]